MTSKLARTRRLAPGRAVPSNQQVGRALKTTCDRVANNPDKFRALLAHPDVIQTSKPHPDIQTRPRREPDGPDKTQTAQTQPQIWIQVWIPDGVDRPLLWVQGPSVAPYCSGDDSASSHVPAACGTPVGSSPGRPFARKSTSRSVASLLATTLIIQRTVPRETWCVRCGATLRTNVCFFWGERGNDARAKGERVLNRRFSAEHSAESAHVPM